MDKLKEQAKPLKGKAEELKGKADEVLPGNNGNSQYSTTWCCFVFLQLLRLFSDKLRERNKSLVNNLSER